MTEKSHAPRLTPPLKNVAASLIFTTILGPLGLLYASFWGAIFMILLGVVVISCQYVFPIILLWVISCIWGVAASERHNRRVISKYS